MSLRVLTVMFLHLLLSASHMPIPVSAGTLAQKIVAGIDSGISARTDVNSYSDDSDICLMTAMNIVAFQQQGEAVSHGLGSHNFQLQG